MTALAKTSSWVLAPTSFGEILDYAKLIANSDLAPKDYKGKPGNVVIAIQMGADVGLSPMQALASIAVINGRASLWGDGMLAVVQASGLLEDFEETFANNVATCRVKRRGFSERVETFGEADAKKAQLWGKAGPWTQYPARMMKMRARAFALRDAFADVLRGFHSAEEVSDYPREVSRKGAPTEAVTAEVLELPKQAEKRTPAEALKDVPSTAAIRAPVFGAKWSKDWASKPVASAPADVVAEYMSYLEGIAADPERQRFHKAVCEHMSEVNGVFDKLLQDEVDKADPVAVALQKQIDAKAAGEKNAAWGMDDVGDQPDDQPSHQEALGYEPGDQS